MPATSSSSSSRWTGDGPSVWREWRRAIVALLVVAAAVVMGVLWFRRDPRKLVLLPKGVMLQATDPRTDFFRDSSLVVQPAEGDSILYPIRVSVWYDGEAPAVSERAIMRAIESWAASRNGAQLSRMSGNALNTLIAPGDKIPWISIEMDVWPYGGFRLDAKLNCRATMEDGRQFITQKTFSSSRGGGVADATRVGWTLRHALSNATRARCPGGRTQASPAPLARAMPSNGDVVQKRAPAFDYARGASSALDRASERNQRVARLVVAVDTVHLRVGEAVNPEQVLRLTALDADGEIVLGFVPLYSVDDMSIAAMGSSGLRGVAVGVTRARVRPLQRSFVGSGVVDGSGEGLSASFVVKVTR
ncbi:MAG: hypothetical protein IT359_16295 [Gemmatimonadaceae bacterium]|nr:hypothetical protein [Gemmatimonadaceae bacterium]